MSRSWSSQTGWRQDGTCKFSAACSKSSQGATNTKSKTGPTRNANSVDTGMKGGGRAGTNNKAGGEEMNPIKG